MVPLKVAEAWFNPSRVESETFLLPWVSLRGAALNPRLFILVPSGDNGDPTSVSSKKPVEHAQPYPLAASLTDILWEAR